MTVFLKAFVFIAYFGVLHGGELPPHGEIKRVVAHYNDAIIMAGKTGQTDLVKPFVSEKLATKTHLWVMSWQDDNLYMDAALNSLNFTKIGVEPNRARVLTRELWTYRYIDAAKRRIAFPATEIAYEMEYRLEKQNNRWIIGDTKILSEKQKTLEPIKK